jgi:hypothetical protein
MVAESQASLRADIGQLPSHARATRAKDRHVRNDIARRQQAPHHSDDGPSLMTAVVVGRRGANIGRERRPPRERSDRSGPPQRVPSESTRGTGGIADLTRPGLPTSASCSRSLQAAEGQQEARDPRVITHGAFLGRKSNARGTNQNRNKMRLPIAKPAAHTPCTHRGAPHRRGIFSASQKLITHVSSLH